MVADMISNAERNRMDPHMNRKAVFRPTVCILATVLSGQLPYQALAADFARLTPHRAVYDLELREASERSGIAAMNGRIAYEINGNACDGLSVRYRFATNITTSERSYGTDQQTATFESPDGREFTFLTRTFVGDQLEKEVKGTAIRTENGITVDLTSPNEQQLQLPDSIFISTHLASIIEQAEQGERFVRHRVFDGSEDADETLNTSGVIGEAKTFPEPLEGEKEEAIRELVDRPAWPVTISYFDREADASAERLPVYEASFLLYDDGVSRKLVLRYDDYSLTGQLSSLEYFEEEPCTPDQ